VAHLTARRIRKAVAGAFQPLESNHSAIGGGYSFYQGKYRISHQKQIDPLPHPHRAW
jgi:hypothetical protein